MSILFSLAVIHVAKYISVCKAEIYFTGMYEAKTFYDYCITFQNYKETQIVMKFHVYVTNFLIHF